MRALALKPILLVKQVNQKDFATLQDLLCINSEATYLCMIVISLTFLGVVVPPKKSSSKARPPPTSPRQTRRTRAPSARAREATEAPAAAAAATASGQSRRKQVQVADTPQEQQRRSPSPPNAPVAMRRRKASELPSAAIAPPAQRRRIIQTHPLPIDTSAAETIDLRKSATGVGLRKNTFWGPRMAGQPRPGQLGLELTPSMPRSILL